MEKLKERIKQSGLKRKFIASKIGIGSSHLTMMLNGNANMPENVEKNINKLLNKIIKTL